MVFIFQNTMALFNAADLTDIGEQTQADSVHANFVEFLTTLAIYNCVERDVTIIFVRAAQALRVELFKRKIPDVKLMIYCGSKWEGMPLCICGNEDTMFVLENWPVVLLHNPTDENAFPLGYLLPESCPGQPAFLRLKAPEHVKYLKPDWGRYPVDIYKTLDSVPETNDFKYANSRKFVLQNARTGDKIQGPSLERYVEPREPFRGTADNIPCLICPSWPICAFEFLIRARPHGWPSQRLINKIQQAGCHVIGIGHNETPAAEKEIQWRWSFSLAESELFHNMSKPCAASMYLFKAMKRYKPIVNPIPDGPTIFCSYFFKTALFWVMETRPNDHVDTIQLCGDVYEWLIEKFENASMPHYFIRTQNLIGHLSCERKGLEAVLTWLHNIKNNLISWTISSLELDETSHKVITDIAKDLKFPMLFSDPHQALLAIGECHLTPKDLKLLQKAKTELSTTSVAYQTKLRHDFVNRSAEMFHPINAALNQIYKAVLVACKKYIPKFPQMPHYIPYNHEIKGFEESIRSIRWYYWYPLKLYCLFKEPVGPWLENYVPSIIADTNLWIGNDLEQLYKRQVYHIAGETLFLLYTKLPRIMAKSRQKARKLAAEHYTYGGEMIYPDGWSDKGLGYLTMLAKLYYFSHQWNKLKTIMDQLAPLLDEAMVTEDRMKSLLYTIVDATTDDVLKLGEGRVPLYDTGAMIYHPVLVGYRILEMFSHHLRDAETAKAACCKADTVLNMIQDF